MHTYHVHMCDKCKSLYVLMSIEAKGQTQMSFFRNYPPLCLRMDLSQRPGAHQSGKDAWSMSSRHLPVSASPELGLLAPTAIVSFIQLKSSCICRKHNPYWAISPALLAGILYIMEPKFIITGFYCEKSILNICENHFFISKANDTDISFFPKKKVHFLNKFMNRHDKCQEGNSWNRDSNQALCLALSSQPTPGRQTEQNCPQLSK